MLVFVVLLRQGSMVEVRVCINMTAYLTVLGVTSKWYFTMPDC